ncbi:hypothetical protein HA402_000497 [Bradysia odoriphaga]|nr:hypothetical protein HA402_000497 [Bradysia odoriphaga]
MTLNRRQCGRQLFRGHSPNGKKSCECRICDSVFDSIAALRKHLDWHAATTDWIHEVDLKSRPEYCEMFGESADVELTNERLAEMLQSRLRENSADVLKMHRITNGQGWELSLTDSETDDDDDENNERKRVFYNCDECPRPRSFDRLYKLMCHMKADHPNASKQFQCTHCLQCFPNTTILEKHLRQQCQNNGKTLHCTMCYSRFTWADSLASHFAVYHQSESRTAGIEPNASSPLRAISVQSHFTRNNDWLNINCATFPEISGSLATFVKSDSVDTTICELTCEATFHPMNEKLLQRLICVRIAVKVSQTHPI